VYVCSVTEIRVWPRGCRGMRASRPESTTYPRRRRRSV